jgi:hypothetical protein
MPAMMQIPEQLANCIADEAALDTPKGVLVLPVGSSLLGASVQHATDEHTHQTAHREMRNAGRPHAMLDDDMGVRVRM